MMGAGSALPPGAQPVTPQPPEGKRYFYVWMNGGKVKDIRPYEDFDKVDMTCDEYDRLSGVIAATDELDAWLYLHSHDPSEPWE
jgi:hypothetical protein